jgi:CRISPR/Cas system-associated protein Cas10 (large subunit of type III CRISPR-Cas system)
LSTDNKQKTCDLCGQLVEIKGFSLESKEGKKEFCCAGCQSIFQLLNEDLLITTQSTKNK